MLRAKLTIRLDPELVELLAGRARRNGRGISNQLEAIVARAFRRRVPYPDRPMHNDQRYTRYPRTPAP